MISQNDIKICQHKRTYATLVSALRMANIINWAHPNQPKQRPYKCPVCHKYHLTCGASNLDLFKKSVYNIKHHQQ